MIEIEKSNVHNPMIVLKSIVVSRLSTSSKKHTDSTSDKQNMDIQRFLTFFIITEVNG